MNEERTEENGWRTNNENCPHCGVSLQGEPVPEKYLTHEPNCTSETTGIRCFCLPYGKVTHFGRKIGIEIQGAYDGVLFWQCPDCGGRWHRWQDAHTTPNGRTLSTQSLRDKAEPYVNGDQ